MTAFLGPLIGLAASGIGSLFGGSNPLTGQLPGAGDASRGILGNVPGQLGTGNTAVGGGLGDLNGAGNFFKTILGGSAEDTQKLLGPQVSTVMKQYDNAAKVAGNLGPRGGGKAGALAEGQTGKAGAYGKILGEALPGAASGLATVGKDKAAIGSNLLGQENSLEGSLLPAQSKAASDTSAGFGQLGSGLGKWLAGMITSKGKGDAGPIGQVSGNLEDLFGEYNK